jgi:hypothetical protein
MRNWNYRSTCSLWVWTSICAAWPLGVLAGGCAVSDGSQLPSDNGCLLAFAYNQAGDERLVVIDEKNDRRYEARLGSPRLAPFWEGGKVYVIATSGSLQGFSIGSGKLVPEKAETISAGVVRTAEYSRGQRRLYLIRTAWDTQQKIFYELVAMDFPARKTLWTKRVDDPGLLRIMEGYVCVAGLKLVEVFNCDTGEKIGGIDATKAARSPDAKAHK